VGRREYEAVTATTTTAFEAAERELERAEDAAAKAGHALAELEERAEDGMGPELAAAIGAAEARLAAAEARLARARARVREVGG
jgi:hypothetical protein